MIRFVWDISADCNYRCPYCFSSAAGWDRLRRLQGRVRAPGDVEAAWRRVRERYGRCRIEITGGEPLLFPEFPLIVLRLGRYHALHVTTNLSQPLDQLISSADPAAVEFNATFHPRFTDCRSFADRVNTLRKAGFSCGACYLAHPSQLRELSAYRGVFARAGIELAVTPYRGMHDGREYPAGYNDGELALLLREGTAVPEGAPEDLRRAAPGLCGAGLRYAAVALDGTVRRCVARPSDRLGSIYGEVVLSDGAYACADMPCGGSEHVPTAAEEDARKADHD